MRFALLPLVISLAACTPTESPRPNEEEPGIVLEPVFVKPDGYPYPMGDMTGTIGPQRYVWKSYDYSVGAIDPSVWLQEIDGALEFHARFESATDPEAYGLVLSLSATPTSLLQQGVSLPITASLIKEDGKANPAILKTRDPATLTISAFTEGGSGSYDRITGQISGKMCKPDGKDCLPVDLRFETAVYQNDW